MSRFAPPRSPTGRSLHAGAYGHGARRELSLLLKVSTAAEPRFGCQQDCCEEVSPASLTHNHTKQTLKQEKNNKVHISTPLTFILLTIGCKGTARQWPNGRTTGEGALTQCTRGMRTDPLKGNPNTQAPCACSSLTSGNHPKDKSG